MHVRALGPMDAATFQSLRLLGLQECPSAFASSFEEESPTRIDVVAERLVTRTDRAVLGAFEEQALVGVVAVQREELLKLAHKAFIWGLYVAPTARRAGIARRLVVEALSFAASSLAVVQVNLGVNAKNVAAIALYKGVGFKQFGLERGFMLLDGTPQDEMHMVCFLQQAT
jgi:ribosomal protein S18 acetylase RimI-like enzyme